MDWKTMLSYISGSVDEELLLRNDLARFLSRQTSPRTPYLLLGCKASND